MGFKSGVELENIIKESKFTLIPAIWYDNLPNTALESFMYSKPVIASNIGSLPELVVDGENGFLFEPGDEDELLQKIVLMDNDYLVEKMGTASYERLNNCFDSSTHYKALIEIFNKVMKKSKEE